MFLIKINLACFLFFVLIDVTLANGLQKNDTNLSIINGQKVKLGELPMAAFISKNCDIEACSAVERDDIWRDVDPICGSTILNETSILTSRNCISKFKYGNLKVYVGGIDATSMSSCYRVKDVHYFAGNDSPPEKILGDRNIAILMLEKPINFKKFPKLVQQVKLPAQTDVPDMSKCQVFGFGKTSEKFSSKFMMVRDVAVSEYTGSDNRLKSFFVTSTPSACKGDEGGALLCRKKNNPGDNSYYQFGIFSSFNTDHPDAAVCIKGENYLSLRQYIPAIRRLGVRSLNQANKFDSNFYGSILALFVQLLPLTLTVFFV